MVRFKLNQVVGVIVIVKGVTLPLMGVERVRRLLDWWSTQESVFLRAWALLAAAIGLWLVYALLPGLGRIYPTGHASS